MLRIEILPAGGKSCSLVQKRLLGNGVGTMTLNCVQHDHRIGEPCAYPASDQSLNMRLGCADPCSSLFRLSRSAAIWRRSSDTGYPSLQHDSAS